MKILLAVDDSKYSDAASRTLITQIRPEGTDVAVLHVIELPLADFESAEVFEAMRPARLKKANELVARFAEQLKKAGYVSKCVVEEGNARSSIIDFAEKWKPDVIFLGSHGRRGWKRLTLGSVSDAVARHASCSVQIVRVPENE